jgi:hypothetical protein
VPRRATSAAQPRSIPVRRDPAPNERRAFTTSAPAPSQTPVGEHRRVSVPPTPSCVLQSTSARGRRSRVAHSSIWCRCRRIVDGCHRRDRPRSVDGAGAVALPQVQCPFLQTVREATPHPWRAIANSHPSCRWSLVGGAALTEVACRGGEPKPLTAGKSPGRTPAEPARRSPITAGRGGRWQVARRLAGCQDFAAAAIIRVLVLLPAASC